MSRGSIRRIGIIVDDLGGSQLNHRLISQVNSAVSPSLDIVVFYENMREACMPMNFATMHMSEAWGYGGTLIATTLSTAEKLASFPSAKSKYFAVWDLEWMRPKYKRPNYADMWKVYGDTGMKLLCRSESHKELIRNCWNRDALEIGDFDIEKILAKVE